MATLKEDVLAAQAKAIALHCDGTVTTAFENLAYLLDGYIGNAKNNIYQASVEDVKAMIDDLRSIGGW